MAKNTMSYQVDHRHILTVSALMHICPKGLVLSSIGLPASSVSVSPIFFTLFSPEAQPKPWAGQDGGLDLERLGTHGFFPAPGTFSLW